ncbi:Transcription elongation factor, mitochondrial [Nymphon striatum]|nr:Transcription elongation factor, mitochondrial [Nymphon striatum]
MYKRKQIQSGQSLSCLSRVIFLNRVNPLRKPGSLFLGLYEKKNYCFQVSLCSFGATRFCQTNSQFDSGLNKVEHENNITAGTKSVAHPIQMYPAPINKDERQSVMDTVKKRKFKYFGHMVRGGGMARAILEGGVEGSRAICRLCDNRIPNSSALEIRNEHNLFLTGTHSISSVSKMYLKTYSRLLMFLQVIKMKLFPRLKINITSEDELSSCEEFDHHHHFLTFFLLQKIQNIVSIFLAPQYISFSHIQKGYQVIDWQVESLHKISSSHKFLLLTEVKNILSTIPPADVYVFEERRVKLKFLGAFSVVMKISNIEAMMIALLSQRSNPNFTSKHSPIALLKAKDVSAHFDLKVGGKLVSGQSAIDSLIEKNGYRKNGPRVELKKPEYNLLSSDKKEMLCKSLLLGLYFGDNICWISDDSENKQ